MHVRMYDYLSMDGSKWMPGTYLSIAEYIEWLHPEPNDRLHWLLVA